MSRIRGFAQVKLQRAAVSDRRSTAVSAPVESGYTEVAVIPRGLSPGRCTGSGEAAVTLSGSPAARFCVPCAFRWVARVPGGARSWLCGRVSGPQEDALCGRSRRGQRGPLLVVEQGSSQGREQGSRGSQGFSPECSPGPLPWDELCGPLPGKITRRCGRWRGSARGPVCAPLPGLPFLSPSAGPLVLCAGRWACPAVCAVPPGREGQVRATPIPAVVAGQTR